jgi:hypothetical protein
VTGESALLTTAEVAVAFAGFASVVTAFRRREPDGWAPQDVIRFQLMIASSLSTAFFALLPIAVGFFGVGERGVWGFASGLLCAYLVLTLVAVGRRALVLTRGASLNPLISFAFISGAVVSAVLLGLNTAGVVFERALGPYFVGLLFLLVLAGVSFARMLPVGLRSDTD